MTESPFSPPTVDEQPPVFSPTAQTQVPLGPRIAGIILVLGALTGLLASQLVGGASVISAMIDLVIGGSLIMGRARFLVWAKLRVVFGLVIFMVVGARAADYFVVAFQAVFGLSLIGLLFGTPSTARIAVATTTAGLCQMTLLLAILGGSIPIFSPWFGQLEDVPEGRIVRDDYQLAVPPGWKLRRPQPEVKAEVWLIHADSDSHVLVTPQRLGGNTIVDLEAFKESALDQLRDRGTVVDVKKTTPCEGGLIMELRGDLEGHSIDYIHRLFVAPGFGARVVAYGPEGKLAPDSRAIVDSFVYGTP